MTKPSLPGGLRVRLAVAISAVALAVVVGTFFAIHEGTGSDLKQRVDSDLNEQYNEFKSQTLPHVRTADQLSEEATSFVAAQAYHPDSLVFLIQSANGKDVTNEHDVIQREVDREADESETDGSNDDHENTMVDAPTGFSTIDTEEAGKLRVLTRPVEVDGKRLGTFRVADPLNSVEEAQAGLRDTFLLVGLLALLGAILISVWIASRITRPLRQMARVASEVDAGDFEPRIGRVGAGDEITVLGDAFDRMLDRLEAAFARQQDFVSDASHELRTPLTVLRGQLEVLDKSGASDQERKQTIALVLREVERMNRLVDEMLTLANVEGGRLVEKRPLDFSDFVEDLRRDLPLFGDRKYTVTAFSEDCELLADPDRLFQVIRNVVRNAVAHTEADGQISVSAIRSGDFVEFVISDDGPGIPPAQLEAVFDRFHRTDLSRNRDSGGSGLGLAIAKAIVLAHGGQIWASSAPGGGAEIHFTIPLVKPA